MWNAFFARRNFYTKWFIADSLFDCPICVADVDSLVFLLRYSKSALRMINMRMEIIMKKRSAMQNFLKNDVAELLRSNLDQNAYGRAEVVHMEMNLAWCYNYVQECCALITDNLKLMETETECPEQCKVAVASVSYAAARFADLPELRDLRTLFTDKYGNALDPYVNKELVEKMKANPPTRETKIQVMKDIAQEFSIAWDHACFQQNLQDGSTRGYKAEQSIAYERTPSYNNKKEADQTRPYNVSSSPYVKLKSTTNGDGDQDHHVKEESEMDKILKHHSLMTWMRTRGNPPQTPSSSGPHGRSVSMYTNSSDNHSHPKLPQYDELANRIRALRQI